MLCNLLNNFLQKSSLLEGILVLKTQDVKWEVKQDHALSESTTFYPAEKLVRIRKKILNDFGKFLKLTSQ